MGFEPTRAEPNGLAVHRLNHSATSSSDNRNKIKLSKTYYYIVELLCSKKGENLAMKMKYIYIPGPEY